MSNTAVDNAATKYNVPPEILYGVWQRETSQGQNVATSTAGAMGNFQFIPTTARQYNYPLTNTPSAKQFQDQADSAAHYLSDLYAQYGDWNTALQHYSGGGYGLDQVKTAYQAASGSKDENSIWSKITSPITAPVNAVKDTGEVVGKFYTLVTDIQTWIRFFEAVAGLALIYFGLKELTA